MLFINHNIIRTGENLLRFKEYHVIDFYKVMLIK